MTVETMRVVEFKGKGGPEVVQTTERSLPVPGSHELLVKVAAAGVNKPDVLQREGHYPPPPGASDIPGLEFSGTIVGKGPETSSSFTVGQKICGLVAGGAYAQYCVVNEDNALPVPDGVALERAAGIPETFCTVWTNLFQDGGLEAKHSLLVHGGSSGIGTTAIQLAKLFGVQTVIVTCGSTQKCEECLELGADLAINYREEDFVKVVLEQTNNKGVDRILDMVGGDYVNRNYQCAAKNARIIQIASLKGIAKEVNVGLIVVKHLTHTGSTLRARSVADKKIVIDDLVKSVWPKFSDLQVPLISATFPYKDARLAHELLDSSAHVGKIIITFD